LAPTERGDRCRPATPGIGVVGVMATFTVCRQCLVTPEGGRRKNRATHVAWFVTGEGSLTCERHAVMAARAGGFAFPRDALPGLIVDDELEAGDVEDLLRAASLTRRVEATPAVRAGPVSFVVTVDGDGVNVEPVRRRALDVAP
jgi:hypothetical protein